MKIKILTLILVLGFITTLFFVALRYIKPSSQGVYPYTFEIEKGQSLFSISEQLYQSNIISSRRVFEIIMLSLGSDRTISYGEFYFERPLNVFEVAFRISGKEFGVEKKRITFPEGFSVKEMGERISLVFPELDIERFQVLASPFEGYLFPDTYSFFPSVRNEAIVETMRNNFYKKIAPYEEEIKKSGRTQEEIIIMASILEKEARGVKDNTLISGILWKRFDMGMRLQVDAPFLYLLGKESSELTRADLQIDSPYNTYRYEGLPPSPINNPGIASIEAALRPQESPYLFYLHNKEGQVFYGKTYQEHLQNIKNHLR